MAKFYGTIGYAISEESVPGVWTHDVVERTYTGDIVKNVRGWRSNENINPDFTLSDMISIITDEFSINNLHKMKYVDWRGAKWQIESVKIERPRMVLTLGGLYSGHSTGVA